MVLWKAEQQEAFEATKQQLTTDQVLVHYDPSKPIILACDAFLNCLKAVQSHQMEEGEEWLIPFASCTLALAEK